MLTLISLYQELEQQYVKAQDIASFYFMNGHEELKVRYYRGVQKGIKLAMKYIREDFDKTKPLKGNGRGKSGVGWLVPRAKGD